MIKIKDLFFSYRESNQNILEGINLEIHKGDYISILGDNGCGKSTLIRLILGFLKPTKGSIFVDTTKIGYVNQRKSTENTDFPITVFEMLNSYRKILKITDKNVVNKSLSLVNMEEYANALVGNLSGGQNQKILIARALIGNPELIILDEPSTGVDVNSQLELYKFIKDINITKKITIVSVEHNLNAALKNSTNIYHLSNGKGHICSPNNYAKEFLQVEMEGK